MPVKKRRVTKGKTKNGDQKTVSRLSEDTAKSKRLSAGSGKRALVLRRSSDKEPSIMMENIPSSLDQIDTIISIVNQPMLAMDFNLQVISANPPFCQTFKISPDKLKGALFYQIGNGLWDVPELKAKLEHVVYDNTLFENVELKLKLPPHQELKIRVSSKIIEDQHKKPQFIFLSFTDITERRKPDETTGDVHSFPDVNPMPVIETDRSGKVLYMNPSAKKLFPQLATTGIRHPFLAELPSAVTELKEGGKAWVRRQVKAEGKWYGQTIYPVENGSRIRIYSADITDAIWVRQVLEASERRFKSIYAESPMGIELFDLDGKLVDANRACLDIFGVSDVTDIKGFNLFEDPNLTVEQKKILKEGKTVSYEGPFDFEKIKEHKLYPTSKSGIIHLDVTVTPLAAAGEEPQKGYLVQVQDITERKHKEDKLRQLNRVLRALSDSNQAMMRSTGESDYMNEVCRLIIDDCGYAMVWIGLAQDDENKTVRPVAQAGFEEGYLETVNITWSDTERGRGPTGTAIRTGKPAVCRNILTDPNFEPWRKEALKRGYASSIVIPLISNDRTLGAINIYSKEPDPFSEEEIDLLTELSSDLAYGITTFRLRIAHQEAEAALAKSEEKYKFLYEEGQSFNLIIGPDQTVKDVNKVALDILSYKINNVIGRPALDFIPQEDQERVKGILAETFTGGTTQEYEVPVLAKDGSVHIILFAPGQATLREGESITGIVVTGIDITERKKAEDALLRAKEEWERTFESVPDLIAILDNRHKIVRMNRAMAQKLGKSPDECIGLNCFKCVHGTPLPPELCPHVQTLRDGQEHISELYEENLGGDFLVSTTPLFDEKGKMTGAVHVARDITERKKAERVLREAKDLLEIRVKERTAELEEANQKLKEEIAERVHTEQSLRLEQSRLDALFRLGQISEAPVNEMAEFTLDQGIALTQSEIGFVGFLSEDEAIYTLHAVSKDVVKECKVTGDPMQWHVVGAGIWAEAIRQRKTLFVNDYNQPHPAKKGLPPGHPPVKRFMVVPVFEGKRIVAVAGMGNKSTDYDKSDERQIVLLLGGMWSYVQRNRSREALQEAYAELEKRVEQRTAELKASTMALKESQSRLQSVLDNSLDVVYRLNLQTNQYEYFSPSCQEIYSYSSEEMMAMSPEESLTHVHPEDFQRVKAELEKSAERESSQIDLRWRTRSGEYRWLSTNIKIIRDADGRLLYRDGTVRDITARKQAEEALRQSELKYRIVSDNTYDWEFWTDAKGKFNYISPSCKRITGYDPSEFMRDSNLRLRIVHPEDRKIFAKHLREAEQAQEGEVEYRIVRKDGEYRWIHHLCQPVYDHQGTFLGTRGSNRDITQRKLAEQALIDSQRDLKRAQKVAHIGSWRLDLERNELVWSEETYRIFGIPPGQSMTYETFLSSVHPDDREFVDEEWQAAMRGKGYDIEHRIIAGKEVKWVREQAELEFDQSGKLTGGFGTVRNITERKKAEEELKKLTSELKEERDLLNTIKENTNTNLAYLDTDFNLVRVNSAFVRTFGHSEEEFVGKNILNLLPGKEYQAMFKKAKDTGETLDLKAQPMKFQDQPERGITYWDLTLIPVKDDLDHVLGLEFSLVDVTEIKRAEEEIRALNEILRQQTADLTASNKELEAFSYSVSHDLRAPLRNINGFSQALLEDYSSKLDETGKNYLNRIRAATQRMGGLIDDLLQLSVTMRKEMKREPVDLSRLVHSIIKELKEAEPQRQVEVLIQENVVVSGDNRLLREMLVNLLGNAWKFTSQCSPSRIEFGHMEKDGDKLFYVKDNGAGFDMKYADKLFIPFQRLHSVSEFLGNGIGLALVKRIIDRHGGSIWAEAEPEKGAIFYFKL